MSPVMRWFAFLLLAGLAQAQVCGDCNGDGHADVLDALRGAQHAAALLTLTGTDLEGCDVDSSTVVTILDALTIAQHAAGLPVSLHCTFTPPPPLPLDITLSGVTAYYNLMPPTPPDPLLVFFDATYTNPAGVPQTATVTSCVLDVTPGAPGTPFTQDLTLDILTSGSVPAAGSVLVSHRKVSGTPLPYTGSGACSATATLTVHFDVGGTPVTVVEPGIGLFCVY
jgi:hypothetical protein